MVASHLCLGSFALAAPAAKIKRRIAAITAKTNATRIVRARSASISCAAKRRPSSFGLDDDLDDLDASSPPRSSSDYALLLSDAETSGNWVKAVELITEARVLRVKLPASGYEAAARAAAEHGDWQQATGFLARAAATRGGGGGDEAPDAAANPPACSAIRSVFSRLAREVQAEACMDLLDLLREGEVGSDNTAGGGDESTSSPSSSSSSSSSSSWLQRPASTRSHALNCAARACARASSGGKKMMKEKDDNNEGAGGSSDEAQLLSDEDRKIFFEASLSLLDDMREEQLQIEDGTFGSCALAALAMGQPELSEELLEERDYL